MKSRHRGFFTAVVLLIGMSACAASLASVSQSSAGMLNAGPTESQDLQLQRGSIQPGLPATHGTRPERYSASVAAEVPTPIKPDHGALDKLLAINPLTGLPADDPAMLDRRPMVIKISNYPRDIRPQYGLNEADVVFEYYIEWGYTRFIGVFYGNNASQIGPVRSGRYFDEHLTRMYQAYYVFNYADPREYNYFLGGDLQAFVIVPGYGSCPPFFQDRVSSMIADVRHYETYFDSTRFGDCLARKARVNSRPDLHHTYFEAATPVAGATVQRVLTYYSRCDYNYWQYDESTSQYLRFQEGNPNAKPRDINRCSDNPRTYIQLTDSVTHKAVSADNLAVIYVSHTFANESEQEDEIYHIDLVDSGRAYVFRDGLAWPARWVRTDIDQPLVLTTLGGEAFPLRPGRTFFQVLGETSDAWSDGTDWQFEFHTP